MLGVIRIMGLMLDFSIGIVIIPQLMLIRISALALFCFFCFYCISLPLGKKYKKSIYALVNNFIENSWATTNQRNLYEKI